MTARGQVPSATPHRSDDRVIDRRSAEADRRGSKTWWKGLGEVVDVVMDGGEEGGRSGWWMGWWMGWWWWWRGGCGRCGGG